LISKNGALIGQIQERLQRQKAEFYAFLILDVFGEKNLKTYL